LANEKLNQLLNLKVQMGLKETELKKLFCLCIHGHFYQPPRDNPFLEIIETQKSAAPYHDWNERITRECYGPNARSRLLGDKGRIIKLINNYSYMSFDFGPTLLSWLEESHPWTYSQVLAADKEGQKKYNGHGNALAHVYNHMIMPLATYRDKLTQIRWGLSDFRHRFGREAEGMWLAETAVDMETLDLMAGEGIKFTILAPDQAMAIRNIDSKRLPSGDTFTKDPLRSGEWSDVKGGRIDPSRPYRVFLNKKANKYIDVFFYDGPLSRAIAYEQVLISGEGLLGRVKNILEHHNEGPRILSIATDGESYGHHFKFGEMALSWLFDRVERDGQIKLVNYGYFLELSPPQQEVRIIEKSSWSCAHGVERWRSDCGCNVGGKKEWNQKWREPLRDGLNWLSGELAAIFEKRARRLLKDPWQARDDYISVLLDDSMTDSFLDRHAAKPLNQDENTEVLCLLESQRMALYMFTSCGWFFDDISGIETIQILMYASRAVELIRRSSPNDLEKVLLKFLSRAQSNDPVLKDGAEIYDVFIKQAKITPSRITAHYAITSLLENFSPDAVPFLKLISLLHRNVYKVNGIKAILGQVQVIEKRTKKQIKKAFLSLRGNEHEFSCVTGTLSDAYYELINNEIAASLSESTENIITTFSMAAQNVEYFNFNDLIIDVRRHIEKSIGYSLYSQIADLINQKKEHLEEFVNVLHSVKEDLPSYLTKIYGIYIFEKFSQLLLNRDDDNPIDFKNFIRMIDYFQPEDTVNEKKHDYKTQPFLNDIIKDPAYKEKAQDFLTKNVNSFADSLNPLSMKNIINVLNFMKSIGVELDLWECQNTFYDIFTSINWLKKDNLQLKQNFLELGQLLGFLIEEK
jgi:alpha-amylase/alpha-mannosidase (GH57 family)